MAFTFPLSRADFLDLLPVTDVKLSCPPQRQTTGLGGGEILTAEVAPALWRGAVALPAVKARAADEIAALLMALDVPGGSFLAYKKNQHGPASDPIGAALSGFSPLIKAVDEPGSQISLKGLPGWFVLSVGDMLSFSYGSAPERRALHRIAKTAAVDGSGHSSYLTITPHLRPGAAVDAAVELVKPYFKAVIVPGSVSDGTTRNGVTSGIGFEFRQSLR